MCRSWLPRSTSTKAWPRRSLFVVLMNMPLRGPDMTSRYGWSFTSRVVSPFGPLGSARSALPALSWSLVFVSVPVSAAAFVPTVPTVEASLAANELLAAGSAAGVAASEPRPAEARSDRVWVTRMSGAPPSAGLRGERADHGGELARHVGRVAVRDQVEGVRTVTGGRHDDALDLVGRRADEGVHEALGAADLEPARGGVRGARQALGERPAEVGREGVERAGERRALVDDHDAAIVVALQDGRGLAVGDGLPAARGADREAVAGRGERRRRGALRRLPAAREREEQREHQGPAQRGAGERQGAGHRI